MNNGNQCIESCMNCGKQLPKENIDGSHNFSYTVNSIGEIVKICISCKLAEINNKQAPKIVA